MVEDEILIRIYARDILTEAGCEVTEASNADDALTLLHQHAPFAAIVTDIEMSRSLNGLTLALRVCDEWPNIPVILTSGRHLPRMSDLPASTRFVAKPYHPDLLVQIVRESIQGHDPDPSEPALSHERCNKLASQSAFARPAIPQSQAAHAGA